MPGISREDEDEQHAKLPPLPGHKDHSCTDIGWFVVLLLAVCGQIYVVQYAQEHGDIGKITRGYDYKGRLCGSDVPGGLMFHCMRPGGDIDMDSPICVDECPRGEQNATHECWNSETQTLEEMQDYESMEVMDFCMPKGKVAKTALMTEGGSSANISAIISPEVSREVVKVIGQVKSAWLPLIISMNIAIVAGYVYLLLLDKFALQLVYVCELVVVLGSWGVGGYLIKVGLASGSDGVEGTGDGKTDLLIGATAICVGCLAVCISVCANRNIQTAVGCIEATCECMFQEPTLLLEPLVALSAKVLLLAFFVVNLLQLISSGKLDFDSMHDGFEREFIWTTEQKLYIAGTLLMLAWLLEICHALSQYTLAWTTQMWYFTPYVHGTKVDRKACGVFRAYGNGLRYHLGTLALGAMLCGIFRPLRWCFGILAKVSSSSENPVSRCTASCCACAIRCYGNFLEMLNKSAYMDVAITSSNYLVAAARALDVLTTEVPALAVLDGAQFVFQLALLAVTSFSGGSATLLLTEDLPVFKNIGSEFYVQDPKLIAVVASVLSGLIGVTFMLVFDTVGDTILYCFATEQRRHSRLDHGTYGKAEDTGYFGWLLGSSYAEEPHEKRVDYAPPRLRELIAGRPTEE